MYQTLSLTQKNLKTQILQSDYSLRLYICSHKGVSCRKNNLATSEGSLRFEKTWLRGGIDEFKKKNMY